MLIGLSKKLSNTIEDVQDLVLPLCDIATTHKDVQVLLDTEIPGNELVLRSYLHQISPLYQLPCLKDKEGRVGSSEQMGEQDIFCKGSSFNFVRNKEGVAESRGASDGQKKQH